MINKTEIIDKDRIRRDIYNTKKVYFLTAFACLNIYLLFNSNSIFFMIFFTIAFWYTMSLINVQTLKSISIDKGDFFLVASKVINGQIRIFLTDGEIELDKDKIPNFEENEDVLIVFVNKKPSFAYSLRKFKLDQELLHKLVITRRMIIK